MKPYIVIPIKGMPDVDWQEPLTNYMASIFGSSGQYAHEIAQLAKLRQDVRGSTQDQVGRDLTYRYWSQLELLELRIPVGDHGCRVTFTWLDALTKKSSSQHSLAFEKASVLFNLAAIHSAIGANSDDYKVSYGAFQAAAGIFSYLQENFLHAPSTDLHQDTAAALSKLMLAQAQEVFIEKLRADGTGKPQMIAKLAKGASNLYKSASASLQALLLSSVWGDKNWVQYCTTKEKLFLAISYQNLSILNENSRKYGESVAYALLAKQTIQDASKPALASQFADINNDIKTLLDALTHTAAASEKDNDLIYHEEVPPASTLPELAGLEAAKPTPLNSFYKDESTLKNVIGGDIFEKLIPLAVHEKSSLYSEEQAQLIRTIGEKVDVSDEELSSALEFLDLPAALKVLSKENNLSVGASNSVDIPIAVNKWAAQVCTDDSKETDVLELRRKISEHVRMAEALIVNLDPSVVSDIKDDIRNVKDSLMSGAASDNKLNALLQPVKNELQMLREGPDGRALISAFEAASASTTQPTTTSLLDIDQSGDDNLQRLIDQAQILLGKLNKLSAERKAVYAELKKKVREDDISQVLIVNQRADEATYKALFANELAKFEPYEQRILATVHHQHALLSDLTNIWKQVMSSDSVKRKTKEREIVKAKRATLVDKLSTAYHAWSEASDGIAKGKEFYSNLEKTAADLPRAAKDLVAISSQSVSSAPVSTLRNNSSAFSSSDDLLRRQLEGLSFQNSSSIPPPLPSKNSDYQSYNAPTLSQQSTGYSASSNSSESQFYPHGQQQYGQQYGAQYNQQQYGQPQYNQQQYSQPQYNQQYAQPTPPQPQRASQNPQFSPGYAAHFSQQHQDPYGQPRQPPY